MTILPENHLRRVGSFLRGKKVLEIGCGDGERSNQLAKFTTGLVGIDPNAAAIETARRSFGSGRVEFRVACAERLPFAVGDFEAVVFVLSLHHIPVLQMAVAIDEALRVSTSDARIIFIEPGFRGSFFELDAAVEACDGDERLQKAQAYAAILSHPELVEIEEFWDETRYRFRSTDDYLKEFELPRDRFDQVDAFLTSTGFELHGERRINVCRKRDGI